MTTNIFFSFSMAASEECVVSAIVLFFYLYRLLVSKTSKMTQGLITRFPNGCMKQLCTNLADIFTTLQ